MENPTELINQTEIDTFERFWSKVNIPDNTEKCWNWLAYKVPKTQRNRLGGYGMFNFNGKTRLSHRIAYELANGDIPKGMFVLHNCDNPSCCNPAHLCVGNNTLNMKHMWDRERARPGHVFGEKHGCSKLSGADINEIHIASKYLYSEAIGKLYGVSGRTIRYILSGQHWKHIDKTDQICAAKPEIKEEIWAFREEKVGEPSISVKLE